jgi:hypothetical protein
MLRRVLEAQAAVGAASGVLLLLLPRTIATWTGLSLPGEAGWMRLAGIQALVISMLLVLVARRVEELWWWSWAFVIGDLGVATLALLKAALGATPGSTAFWWATGVVHGTFGAGLLAGIARAGRVAAERDL